MQCKLCVFELALPSARMRGKQFTSPHSPATSRAAHHPPRPRLPPPRRRPVATRAVQRLSSGASCEVATARLTRLRGSHALPPPFPCLQGCRAQAGRGRGRGPHGPRTAGVAAAFQHRRRRRSGASARVSRRGGPMPFERQRSRHRICHLSRAPPPSQPPSTTITAGFFFIVAVIVLHVAGKIIG